MIVAREQVQHDYGVDFDKEKRRRSLKRKRRLSRSYRITMVSMVALVFFIGVIISFYYAQVFVATYQVNQLQSQLQSLQQEYDSMQGKVARLTSLERIKTVAVNDLGMVKPEDSDVMQLEIEEKIAKDDDLTMQAINQETGKENNNNQQKSSSEENWLIKVFANLVNQVSTRASSS